MSNILRSMKEKEPGNGLESELWWVETYRFYVGFMYMAYSSKVDVNFPGFISVFLCSSPERLHVF